LRSAGWLILQNRPAHRRIAPRGTGLRGLRSRSVTAALAPGANALATRDAVIAKMDELARQFPPGVNYRSTSTCSARGVIRRHSTSPLKIGLAAS
jgi:hypothetical protein